MGLLDSGLDDFAVGLDLDVVVDSGLENLVLLSRDWEGVPMAQENRWYVFVFGFCAFLLLTL